MPEDLGQLIKNLGDAMIRTDRRTHAGLVMAMAAALEDDLERCLLVQMSSLSKRHQERLFRGYGPLSTFSAKIDVAFAFEIIDHGTLAELNKIKEIRNRFAHGMGLYSLDQPPMRDLFNKLNRPSGAKGTYLEVFMACVMAIDDELEKFLATKGAPDGLQGAG